AHKAVNALAVEGLPETVKAADFRHIKVGDIVYRRFIGKTEPMKVTAVDDSLITAGLGWQFERNTGFEYDEDCRSGSKFGIIISHLVPSPEEAKNAPQP